MQRKIPTKLTDTWGETWTPVSHAARFLGVSVDTVRSYVETGKLTGKKLRDHWLYVRYDQVEELARARGLLAAGVEVSAQPSGANT